MGEKKWRQNGVEEEGSRSATGSPKIMPGVLKRSHDRMVSDGAGGDARATTPDSSRKRQVTEMVNGEARQNGLPPSTNGVYANGMPEDPSLSANRLEAVVDELSGQAPPEIDHLTMGFIPISEVIKRFNQETFIEFEAVINAMADLQSSQINGHGSAQSTQINAQKKTKLWDFAQERRARYIKILVLSQWGRQSEAVSQLIDLNHWMLKQKSLFKEAVNWMGELKRIMSFMRLPAPDLHTALEVLSTGKADWISDLSFLPVKDLTPKELLTGLRNANTVLTIRINLHETIPREMADFSIQSGRATFRVKDEFELDVSIADDDPSSQLYFIDFRFAFSPRSSDLEEGLLRDQIEIRVNDILRREGLPGCYDFLHDLVLTHKLNIFRHQAVHMIHNRWTENIKMENAHRALVIQYWIHRPGKKNWIELGIKKGRGRPYISMRWHRHGKEVLDHEVDLDVSNLSLEDLLMHVIAKHTNYIFKETKRKLRQGTIYASKLLSLKHKANPNTGAESSLRIQVTPTNKITLLQEPISGMFSISPPSKLHHSMEPALNSLHNPATDAWGRIATIRILGATEQIIATAKNIGWKMDRTIVPNAETLKKHFKTDLARTTFFKVPKWDEHWFVVLTTSLEGDRWWVVETRIPPVRATPEQLASGEYQAIKKVLPITIEGEQSGTDPRVLTVSRESLGHIETFAAAVLSQWIDCHELTQMALRYRQTPAPPPPPRFRVPEVWINIDQRSAPVKQRQSYSAPWGNDLVKCAFVDLAQSRDCVVIRVAGRLFQPMPDLVRLVGKSDCALTFSRKSTRFTFKIETPIGKSSMKAVFEHLDRLAILIRYVTVANSRQLSLTKLSLSSISFQYQYDNPTVLPAYLKFEPNRPMELSFDAGNPHLRIKDSLNNCLNDPTKSLAEATSLLETTSSLLRGFDFIESVPRNNGVRAHILPKSATAYKVIYTSKYITFSYDISIRQKGDDWVWWINAFNVKPTASPSGASPGSTAPANLSNKQDPKSKPSAEASATALDNEPIIATSKMATEAYKSLFHEPVHEWDVLGQSLVTPFKAAKECITRIDEVISPALAYTASSTTDGSDPEAKAEPSGLGGTPTTMPVVPTAPMGGSRAPTAPMAPMAPMGSRQGNQNHSQGQNRPQPNAQQRKQGAMAGSPGQRSNTLNGGVKAKSGSGGKEVVVLD